MVSANAEMLLGQILGHYSGRSHRFASIATLGSRSSVLRVSRPGETFADRRSSQAGRYALLRCNGVRLRSSSAEPARVAMGWNSRFWQSDLLVTNGITG